MLLACVTIVSTLLLLAPSARAAVTLPANFDDQLVASVEAPTAVAFTPDGRLLIATQPGVLQIKDGALAASGPKLKTALRAGCFDPIVARVAPRISGAYVRTS